LVSRTRAGDKRAAHHLPSAALQPLTSGRRRRYLFAQERQTDDRYSLDMRKGARRSVGPGPSISQRAVARADAAPERRCLSASMNHPPPTFFAASPSDMGRNVPAYVRQHEYHSIMDAFIIMRATARLPARWGLHLRATPAASARIHNKRRYPRLSGRCSLGNWHSGEHAPTPSEQRANPCTFRALAHFKTADCAAGERWRPSCLDRSSPSLVSFSLRKKTPHSRLHAYYQGGRNGRGSSTAGKT